MMGKDPITILSLKIDQSFEEVDKTRELLADILVKKGLDEEIISRVELSIYEVLVNIIEHSSEKYNDSKIDINCFLIENSIKVIISNYGDKFDLTKTKLPNIEEHYQKGKKRGLGIYFIRTLMDKVDYSYSKNMNTLTMIKDF